MKISETVLQWISRNGVALKNRQLASSDVIFIGEDDKMRFLNGSYFYILLTSFGKKVNDVELLVYLRSNPLAPGFDTSAVKANMKVILSALKGIGLTFDKSIKKKI
jgi:hypothetical protein